MEITGSNRGGLLGKFEGVNVFVPWSQVAGPMPAADGARPYQVGRVLIVKAIEVNRERNKAVLSERAAMAAVLASRMEHLLKELTVGEIRRGTVRSVRNFGAFIDLGGGVDGLAHISELSWDHKFDAAALFGVGQEVDVRVIRVDFENQKISLSVRQAAPEQWAKLATHYEVGDIAPAVITRLATFGAFAPPAEWHRRTGAHL